MGTTDIELPGPSDKNGANLLRSQGKHGFNFEILLDGEAQKDVITYDVQAGTVERIKRTKAGAVVVKKGLPVHETVKGKVEVNWL